jgi:uncharacterized protein
VPNNHILLIIPGLGDSGHGHWQNYWLESLPNAIKVKQDNWHQPQLTDWLKRLNETLESIDGPVIAVAHSLAVSLFAHWVTKDYNTKVVGALLVAPADVDSPLHTPEETWNFAPIPTTKLPFPSIVVTSTNDPYISKERAELLANLWGSEFVNLGALGHINSASDLGNWEDGQKILIELLSKIKINKN